MDQSFYSYRHDEESDEECQEGFNYEAYEARYENHKEKWHAITPQVIIETFKAVTAYNPCTESCENQELKQSFTPSEYSQLMQKQLPQMIAFLSEKEFSAYEFFSQYTNKNDKGIKRLINKKPPELLQILLVCLKYMHNKEPSDLSEDGTLIYPVPQKECDKILVGISDTIEFNWDQNRNKFLIPI
ncbi:MAG: hypothetical protein AB8B80_02225 [Marinicellaceae bacterium]